MKSAGTAWKPVWRTDAATSERMSRIRTHATAPEVAVRHVLTRLGVRWTTCTKGLPGRPDLIDPDGEWAVLVHGCYWHRHKGCYRTTTPTRNRRVWLEKFRRNVER